MIYWMGSPPRNILIPADFAPFNVQNINCKIFVTFAKQDVQKHNNLNGPGLGFVDVFDTDGNLLMSLEYGDWMDAPWGIALAPSDFGSFSDDLLVGNFGSGQIAAFDPGKGKFHAILKNTSGEPIIIEGLWGLGFGNGATAGPKNNLFFTAGINDEAHGLFGTITTILPVPVSNLIKNLGFESGRKDWVFYTNGTVRFNIISPGFEGNNASEVKIMRRSSNMQLYQKELALKPDTHYRLSFAAKSSKGHDVRVVLLKHSSPFTNYGLLQHFNLI